MYYIYNNKLQDTYKQSWKTVYFKTRWEAIENLEFSSEVILFNNNFRNMKPKDKDLEEIIYNLQHIRDNMLDEKDIKSLLFMCSKKLIDLAFWLK